MPEPDRRVARALGPARARRTGLLAPAARRRYARAGSVSPSNGTVHVRVRLGAGLATAAGTRRLGVDLPGDATVAALVARLREREPAIATGLDRALAIVRGAPASGGQPLADGDEVAFLLPVAGGATGTTASERSSSWP